MMVKSGLEFFYFEILRAPSEIPANLPGQFSRSGQIFLHWAAWESNELFIFPPFIEPFTCIVTVIVIIMQKRSDLDMGSKRGHTVSRHSQQQ